MNGIHTCAPCSDNKGAHSPGDARALGQIRPGIKKSAIVMIANERGEWLVLATLWKFIASGGSFMGRL